MVACLSATPSHSKNQEGLGVAIAGSDLRTQRTAVNPQPGRICARISWGFFFCESLSGPLFYRAWEGFQEKLRRRFQAKSTEKTAEDSTKNPPKDPPQNLPRIPPKICQKIRRKLATISSLPVIRGIEMAAAKWQQANDAKKCENGCPKKVRNGQPSSSGSSTSSFSPQMC